MPCVVRYNTIVELLGSVLAIGGLMNADKRGRFMIHAAEFTGRTPGAVPGGSLLTTKSCKCSTDLPEALTAEMMCRCGRLRGVGETVPSLSRPPNDRFL